MSDDLLDLNGLEVFNFDPDWIVEPSKQRIIQVSDNIYPGTIHSLNFNRDPVKKLKFQITDTDTKLYTFLLFFADMCGRYKSFWMPDLFQRFTVEEIIFTLDKKVRITKLSNLYLHGHERLFILLRNGDRISRKIESMGQLENQTEIVVSTEIPEFDIADIALCSLIYLGRLDQDAIEIKYDSDKAANCEVSFVELLEEYSEIDGD